MEPFYFGPDDAIFGVYHAAEGMPKRHSVVVAAPLLNEYMRAHFALRQISLKLARAGFDVLRFDYSGMGDSKGALEDTPPARWIDDIRHAMQEITDISGSNNVSIIAVRFAANLAASVTAERTVDQFVMWDPILDGPHWLELLRKARPVDSTQFSEALLVREREFMGHLTHPDFVEFISARSMPPIESRSTFAVITDKSQIRIDTDKLARRIDTVSFSCGWEDLSSQVLYPHEVIDSICAAIT